MSKNKPERPNGFTDKAKRFIGSNKQLIIGIAIGALIMLPTGLYVNERSKTNQKQQGVQQPTDTTIKEPEIEKVEPTTEQAPAPQTTPQQATPAPKKSGVDCVALNNVQQSLINDSEKDNYDNYLFQKKLIQDDPNETPELKELNITHQYNKYQTAVNQQKYLAVNLITGARCMPTVSVTFRAR